MKLEESYLASIASHPVLHTCNGHERKTLSNILLLVVVGVKDVSLPQLLDINLAEISSKIIGTIACFDFFVSHGVQIKQIILMV